MEETRDVTQEGGQMKRKKKIKEWVFSGRSPSLSQERIDDDDDDVNNSLSLPPFLDPFKEIFLQVKTVSQSPSFPSSLDHWEKERKGKTISDAPIGEED